MRIIVTFWLLLTSCCILVTGLHAQGTLQYNQVLLVSTVQTVPSGKVWKVESILASSDLTSGISVSSSQLVSNSATMLVNGSTVYVDGVIYANYSSYGKTITDTQPTKLPLWLPAGTTLASSANALYVSVIEFNIVP